MKNFTMLLMAICFSTGIYAQTANAVVLSDEGNKFTLILNGEPQNATPQTTVKVSGLTNPYYSAKIVFEDKTLPEVVNRNFAVEPGSEVTYIIKKTKKGDFALRYHSVTQATTAVNSDNSSTIDPELKRITEVQNSENNTSGRENHSVVVGTPAGSVNTDVVITESTETTTRDKDTNGENVNIGMNIGGLNMGVNVNVNDRGNEKNTSSNVTTTTTTTTTTTRTDVNSGNARKDVGHQRHTPREDIVVSSTAAPCGMKMSNDSFSTAKKSIADKGFDDTRLTVPKQVTSANCLTVSQIKDIMGVFGFEETKLDYAKYAYDYCINRNEYYLINDAFSFSSSIDELNKFIMSK